MDEIRVPAAGGDHDKKLSGRERMWRLVDKTRAECGCEVSRTCDEDLELSKTCPDHAYVFGAIGQMKTVAAAVNTVFRAWIYNVWNHGVPFKWTEYRRK